MSARAIRLIACAGIALLGASVAVAQRPDRPAATATVADSLLDARTRALAAQLRCPVCQGLSLQDSPSELAQEMRDVVAQQLASGKTEDEVKAFFVGRYGEWILMSPTAHGFNWVVYLLPVLALTMGAAFVGVAVRRWTSAPMHPAASRTPSAQTPTTL
jgi:cytochrome c-type biogenesis protein CcmH